MSKTLKLQIALVVALLGAGQAAQASVNFVVPKVAHEGSLELLAGEGSLEDARDGSLKMMTQPGMSSPSAFLLAVNERARVYRVTTIDTSDECGVVVYGAESHDGSVMTVVDPSGNRCHKTGQVWQATLVSPTEGRALWAVHAN